MANPEGTQAGEPYQNFENRRRAAFFNYTHLPMIGEGALGSGSKPLLKDKKRLVMLVKKIFS